MREISYKEASMEAPLEEFRRDEKTIDMGTDIPVSRRQEFGKDRVRATPI